MELIIYPETNSNEDFGFIERKGRGHPDTLADGLAEHLSVEYSKYTLKKFGAILHHNFDKVGLLGGSSAVEFGHAKLIKPIRVLLNGRASNKFGNDLIPVLDLLKHWTKLFFKTELPTINPDRDLEFYNGLSTESSPGKTKSNSTASARPHWFQPRGLQDIPELTKLVANDTSIGVGYAPFSNLELFVLELENHLNSDTFRSKHPWIGYDIKLLGHHHKAQHHLTLCIPQIANFVPTPEAYAKNLETCYKIIYRIAKKNQIHSLQVSINTRDDYEKGEFYLTATGSSIESGDEGFVGRGNRINGIISPFKPMSMEGAAGKNPVYHIGKVYYAFANELAHKIFKLYKVQNKVAVVSQSGRDLVDPWIVLVSVPATFRDEASLKTFVASEVKKIPKLTDKILQRKVKLF